MCATFFESYGCIFICAHLYQCGPDRKLKYKDINVEEHASETPRIMERTHSAGAEMPDTLEEFIQ